VVRVHQPPQVKVEPAHPSAAHLHHGEVAVVDQGRIEKVGGGRGPAVDLDRGFVGHPHA
jgi:hypothetical protein